MKNKRERIVTIVFFYIQLYISLYTEERVYCLSWNLSSLYACPSFLNLAFVMPYNIKLWFYKLIFFFKLVLFECIKCRRNALISKSSLLEILCSRKSYINCISLQNSDNWPSFIKSFQSTITFVSLLSASMLANVWRCFSIFLCWMCRRGNNRRVFSLKERTG